MSKNVGVLGSGVVGETLANAFLSLGYAVMRGSRDPSKLDAWRAQSGPQAHVGSFEATAAFGSVIVLCVRGTAAEAVVRIAAEGLDDKLVLDATNPISEAPPEQSVLQYFTGPNESLMERLQKLAPKAKFVKAFSSVGAPLMFRPDFSGQKPTMFICGDDASARSRATEILTEFGWETEDLGGAPSARAIEPLAMLWCIPGMRNNQWSHAFKLLRA
ncbi:MAG: NAD(P)-binding domain-containing protein [Deltaproteobacteria bacterium]|nr:NAD(P)-binding domain-containing protein [Deltaproteobacteria bacterium]